MSAASESFEDLVWQQRIGLRYINQLEADADAGLGGMVDRINPELLHPLGNDSGMFDRINSSFQELRVAQEFGVCAVRHGLQVDDQRQAAYILDFDYYDDAIARLDIPKQIELLKAFNLGVWSIFRWCLSDEQYQAFEPEERQ